MYIEPNGASDFREIKTEREVQSDGVSTYTLFKPKTYY